MHRVPSALLALAILVLVASGAAHAAEPIRADAIVEMLSEGISADVVLAWLSSRTEPVAPLAADDLLRLRRAGADDALLRAIVERASPTPAVPAAATPGDGEARVDVAVEYRAVEPLEGDEHPPSPDLVLYVDGRFLARLASQGDIGRKPLRFRTRLPAGRHVVRFAREWPEREGDVARLAPEAIELDLAAGDRWAFEFRWTESIMEFGRPTPLAWTLLDDGERVAGVAGAGTPTDAWPELCEDLETALGGDPSRSDRRRLERCVRWSGLFPGIDGVPPRDAVRPARTADGTAPPPAARPLDAGLRGGSDG